MIKIILFAQGGGHLCLLFTINWILVFMFVMFPVSVKIEKVDFG